MKNRKVAPLDYDAMLVGLKAQKEDLAMQMQELECVIEGLNRLKDRNHSHASGLATPSKSANNGARRDAITSAINLKATGIYECTVALVEKEKRPLTHRELYAGMLAGGKIFTSNRPVESIAGTLYRTARDNPNCGLKRIGDGWGLREWATASSSNGKSPPSWQ